MLSEEILTIAKTLYDRPDKARVGNEVYPYLMLAYYSQRKYENWMKAVDKRSQENKEGANNV